MAVHMTESYSESQQYDDIQHVYNHELKQAVCVVGPPQKSRTQQRSLPFHLPSLS